MSGRAPHFLCILVSHCRRLNVFNGQYTYHDLEPEAFWLAQEQMHRLENLHDRKAHSYLPA